MVDKKTIILFQNIAKTLAPPPTLKISQWADRYRVLSSESSAEAGKWNTARAEYQREIMDCIIESDIEDVVVMSSAQVGKTEILLNVIAYFIDYDPSPMILIQPTDLLAQAFSKDRLAPMIRDTPKLKNKIADAKSRDSENTILHKKFMGGHITMIGANTPTNLASRPIRIVLCDEVDRYPTSAGKEGDVVKLAEKRTNNFWNRKKIKVSTPTIKGQSAIEKEYQSSSQGEWCVYCPSCNMIQRYDFKRLRFDDAKMKCICCNEYFSKTEWESKKGIWIHRYPENKKRGFHLNEMASSWRSWEEIIKDFKNANDDFKNTGSYEALKVFVNTALGESWELRGKSADDDSLIIRRELYSADLPEGVLLLTAGVDVQDDRFEIEVVGWGKGYESWGIQYHKIYCNPAKQESWEKLEKFLENEYYFEKGNSLLIAAACIDTGGHHTDESYHFLNKMEKKNKRIYGVKGMGGAGFPLIYKESRNTKNKVKIFILGVDAGKEKIFARLQIEEIGAGYCHFPLNEEKKYDEVYMKGLNSEQLVTSIVNGRAKNKWVKKSGARNEPLDLRNYATAAAEILSPNWDSLEKKVNAGINYMRKSDKLQNIKRRGAVRGLML